MFAFILDRAQSLVPYFRILDRARDDYCRVFYHSAYFPEESDDEDLLEDDEPDLDTVMIQHNGAINRIRVSFGHGVAYLFVNFPQKLQKFQPTKIPTYNYDCIGHEIPIPQYKVQEIFVL